MARPTTRGICIWDGCDTPTKIRGNGYPDSYCQTHDTMRVKMRKYGVSKEFLEELELLVHCPLCGDEFDTYGNKRNYTHNKQIDHCHKTGKVRGIICRQCNLALGNARDNIQTLENMITYIKENK